MKLRIATMCALVAGAGFMVHAQDYDDIYSDGTSSELKTVVTPVKGKSSKPGMSRATSYRDNVPVQYTVTVRKNYQNERDVDEYNRRGGVYDGVGLNDAYPADSTQIIDDEAMFANTQLIERFYNPDIIISSDDEDLVDLYYDTKPQVTVILGSNAPYYRPAYWRWGYSRWYTGWNDPWYDYYDPFYYSAFGPGYWGWYGYYHPWSWGWGWNSWYGGWYGGGWHYGWHRPYGGYWGARPGYWGGDHRHYAGGGNYRGRGTLGGRTPGRSAYSPTRMANNRAGVRTMGGNTGRRPGYATTGNVGTGGRMGVNRSTGTSRGSVGSGTTGRRPGYATGSGSTPSRSSSSWGTSRSSSSHSSSSYGGSRSSSSSHSSGSYSGGSRSGGYSGGSSGGGRSGGGGFSGGGGRRR